MDGSETRPTLPADNTYPIDLANALSLAGANSLDIELAREKVSEAEAVYDKAAVLWLPSLRFGIGWNKHDGRIQQTEGDVLEINRNSLFYGGGAGPGMFPVTGGASGPARLMVNLALADVAFEPLVACQLVHAEAAASEATENDILLAVALAYFDLVEAHAMLAINEQTAGMANRMSADVATFKEEGYSSAAEVARAEAEAAHWQQQVADSRRDIAVKSAALARLVRLPVHVLLVPVEVRVVPIELVDGNSPVDALVQQGVANRPEIAQHDAIAQATCWQTNQEHWRPWLPHVHVGASAGSFGGGPSSDYLNEGSRSDVDLIAVWELQNAGFGTTARRRLRDSQHWQAEITSQLVRDHVAAQIASAAADVNGFREQIDIAAGALAPAEQSYQLNDERIREGEGLPIEVIQSIRALAAARAAHAKAVLDHNRAQYRLHRAIGQPADAATITAAPSP
jgi:outer membrane protein TolC